MKHIVEVVVDKELSLDHAELLKDFFYEALEKFKQQTGLDLHENTDVIVRDAV